MNRRDENGTFVPSNPAFQITETGAEANLAAHRTRLAANINSAGSVQVQYGATIFQSHPLCIGWYDPADGRFQRLSDLTNSIGWLTSSNSVTYSNCFCSTGVLASLVFQNAKSGLEQFLLLHACPDPPQDFSSACRLELFTEVIGDTPEPQKTDRIVGGERDPAKRQTMLEPDLIDSTLDFHGLRMIPGTAFLTGAQTSGHRLRATPGGAPVAKRYEVIQGRRIMIEALEFRRIQPMLTAIRTAQIDRPRSPVPAAFPSDTRGIKGEGKTRGTILAARALPDAPPSKPPQGKIQTAQIRPNSEPGSPIPSLAWDYDLVPTQDPDFPQDFTFYGDRTYLVSEICDLWGNTTIQGGSIVKYIPNDEGYAIIELFGNIIWATEAGKPAIFTSMFDCSVGDLIDDSSLPSNFGQALAISSSTNLIHHVRVSYADFAVHGYNVNVRSAQFTHCGTVFAADGVGEGSGACNVENVLISDAGTVFSGMAYRGMAVNLTIDSVPMLCGSYSGSEGCSMNMTNCLFYNTNDTEFSPTVDHCETADSSPFAIAGSGAHYLSGASYLHAGTTNINSSLLSEVRGLCTRAPTMLTNTTITNNMTLSIQVPRESGDPDLGYHFGILDWIVSNVTIASNVTVVASHSVSIGVDYLLKVDDASYSTNCAWGFILNSGRFISQGGPGQAMNHIVRAGTVQEASAGNADFMALFYDHPGPYEATPPRLSQARFRFTDISQMAGDGYFLFTGKAMSELEWTHSRVYNSFVVIDTGGSESLVCGLTNTLWELGGVEFGLGPTNSAVRVHLRNNLARDQGWHFLAGSTNWTMRDNLFDTMLEVNDHGGPIQHSFNAFFQTVTTNLSGGTSNLTLTNLVYEAGPFSAPYQPTNSPLLRAGSRAADQAGLFWFTATANPQILASNSTVSIGLHQPAIDGNGLPIDADNDGMPNDWEITNGLNPIVNDADDDPDGDDSSNYDEYLAGSNPQDKWIVMWGTNTLQQTQPPAVGEVVAVAAGFDHQLVLRNNGTVLAWGSNSHGQTNVPAGMSNAVGIAAGFYHSLAVRSNGSVSAWGDWYGQGFHTPVVPGDLTNITAVAAGLDHDLALRSNGTVRVWGYTNEIYNTELGGLDSVKAIAAGWNHNVALLSNGTVRAWGMNWGGAPFYWNVTNVPAGLTNVVAIAAGSYHTLALKADGTVVAWGAGQTNGQFYGYGQAMGPAGLSNVVAIAAGGFRSVALVSDGTVVTWGDAGNARISITNVLSICTGVMKCMAVRSGRQTPIIISQPMMVCSAVGRTAVFNVRAVGRAALRYQWEHDGTKLAGATNATLTITNLQSGDAGDYRVVVSNRAGAVNSETVTIRLGHGPLLAWSTQPSEQHVLFGDNFTLSLVATNELGCDFPIIFSWYHSGVNFYGPIDRTNHPTLNASAAHSGVYSNYISNGAGSTSVVWTVWVAGEGSPIWWGNITQAWDFIPGITNVVGLAGGGGHNLLLTEDGSVLAWGTNDVGQTNVPAGLINVVAVAAGGSHSLALRKDGAVVAWGVNNYGQTNVPTSLTNAVAVAAGGQQSLALKNDGTVVQWGRTNANVPSGLASVKAIASGTNFHLALLSNSTVVAWGTNDFGQTNVPGSLSNVVAIAAGGSHALALRENGTVVAWGSNTSGETNIPAGLTNIMAVAAGYSHSLALSNNGTVIAWGDNTYGQTNPPRLSQVKLIAAGGYQNLVSIFSPLLQYQVDVTRDLLLVYNTNSIDSSNVCAYYLQHRPMVSGANVLGIDCVTNETALLEEYTNQIAAPILNWLYSNPTKRPEYVILFLDIPARVHSTRDYSVFGDHDSVSISLHDSYPGLAPFITHINLNGTNDCRSYIDKLASFGTNFSPGQLLISARAGGYGNTNWYFDDTQNTSEPVYPGLQGAQGVTSNGAAIASVVYVRTNDALGLSSHITSGTNVAGYLSWGQHSSLGGNYAKDGTVKFSGASAWYLIATVESYNGKRDSTLTGQGNVLQWFSPNAFGGTNYSNTPVGAISYVDEPLLNYINESDIYFGQWQRGRNFLICAWTSIYRVGSIQSWDQFVGDPFITK